MASSEAFLLQLATEENIPAERIRPIIDRLNQEWYDSAESLRQLSTEAMVGLGIPLRLANLIQTRLARPEPVSGPVSRPEQVYAPVSRPILHKGEALAALVSAGIEDEGEAGLVECITTLQTIVLNLLRFPQEDKYKRIRLSNAAITKKIGRFPEAIRFLQASGFNADGDSLLLGTYSESGLRESLSELNTVAENLGFPSMDVDPPSSFNPYQAQVSSTNPDLPRIVSAENDPKLIAERMELLRKQREEAIKQMEVNRNPQVMQISETGNLKEVLRRLEMMESERLAAKYGVGYTVSGGRVLGSAEEDEELGAAQALIRENEENSKFHSKRKVQLNRFERQKSYGTVTIRVRFPDRYLLQGSFSSLESTQSVYAYVSQYLVTPDRPFALYVAPPKQVIESSAKRTLAEFAPATLFNFSWKDRSETGPSDGPFLHESLQASAQRLDS